MLKKALRLSALALLLAVTLASLAPRKLDAKVFCINECNNHQMQLCCGECSPRFGCNLICHPPTGPC